MDSLFAFWLILSFGIVAGILVRVGHLLESRDITGYAACGIASGVCILAAVRDLWSLAPAAVALGLVSAFVFEHIVIDGGRLELPATAENGR